MGTATLRDRDKPHPAAGTHLTYLPLTKSQVAVALQNTLPLSCLNLMRARSQINRPPAGLDWDGLVFTVLVTGEGQGTSYTIEEQDMTHGGL